MRIKRTSESLLISAMINTRDDPSSYGVTAEMFHSYSAEFQWLTTYEKLYGVEPSKEALMMKFPDFPYISEAHDTAFAAEEVITEFTRRGLVKAIHRAADNLEQGNIEEAMMAVSSFIPPARSKPLSNDLTDFDFLSDYHEQEDMLGVPWDTLSESTGGIRRGDLWYVAARLGQGKALRHGSRVAVPGGFTNIENLGVGDKVIGSNGRATKIIAVHPQGKKEIIRVKFSDNSVVEVCEDHLWTVRVGSKPWKVVTTRSIIGREGQNYIVPSLSGPIQYSERRTSFDPYKLGLLLGDGSFRGNHPSFTTADPELADALSGVVTKWKSKYGYGLKNIKLLLKKYGLLGKKSNEKFIPDDFLYASPDKRLALLQGLMDTDGNVTATGAEFSSTSYELARGVQHLTESLGGYAHFHNRQTYFNGKPGLPSYRLVVVLPKPMCPFRLKRKVDTWRPRTSTRFGRSIVSAERTGQYDEMTCITVEATDSLFAMDHCILTHNSWVLANFAKTALLEGQNVRFYSLEMSKRQVLTRMHVMLGAALDLDVDHIAMRDRVYDPIAYRKIANRIQDDIPGKLSIADSSDGRVNPTTIARDKGWADLVIVDYAGLMSTPLGGRAIDDWRSMGVISNMLKEVAVSHDLRIVAAAQINRDGDTGANSIPPKVKNLAQSDSLGQDADVVLTHKQMSRTVMVYGIEKNRHGEGGGRFYTRFLPNQGRFNEVDRDRAEDIRDEENDE